MNGRWLSVPNCDVTDLNPGDLIAWEGRALRVIAIYPVEPVDWHDDERPGQIQAFGVTITDEHPPCRIHLDDGTRKGLHLRIGFRSIRSRTVERLKPHHATCAHCGHLWPCPDERIDREVAAAAHELARTCTHCGKTGGGMQCMGGEHLDIPGQIGAWFHTRKKGGCAAAAEAYRVRWQARSRVLREAEAAARGDA